MKVNQLTRHNFEKWGQFFDSGEQAALKECDGFNYAGNVGVFPASGECSISVLQPLKREMAVEKMEMHKETPEVCIAMENDCVIVVADGGDGGPDPGTMQAFLLKQGCTVIYNAGIWHWVPFPVGEGRCKQLIIYKNNTGANDFYMQQLSQKEPLE